MIIFIVGNSRSGTTMFSRILNNHNEIFSFHEIHFFEELVTTSELDKVLSSQNASILLAKLISIQRIGYLKERRVSMFLKEAQDLILNSNEIDDLTPKKVYQIFLQNETELNNKTIPCEQTPRYIFSTVEILKEFPNARIINMIRDPRSILLSQKNKWKRRKLGANNIGKREALRSWTNYHPITTSLIWRSVISKGLDYNLKYQRFTTIFFEDLIRDPQRTLESIFQFLKLTEQDNLLKIPQIGSSQLPDEKEILGLRKIDFELWKKGGLTNEEIFICQMINKKLLKELGYSEIQLSINIFKLIILICIFPFKILLSLILNFKRYNNLFTAIKGRFYVRPA